MESAAPLLPTFFHRDGAFH